MSRAQVSYPTSLPQPGRTDGHPSDPPAPSLGIRNQAIRYAGLSALSFVGNILLIVMLHEGLGLSSYIAVPIAMACMTVFNFFTIRMAIFRDSAASLPKQFAGFVASIAGFRVVEYFLFILIHGLLTIPYLPAYASILIGVTVTKFLFLRNVLFAGAKCGSPSIAAESSA